LGQTTAKCSRARSRQNGSQREPCLRHLLFVIKWKTELFWKLWPQYFGSYCSLGVLWMCACQVSLSFFLSSVTFSRTNLGFLWANLWAHFWPNWRFFLNHLSDKEVWILCFVLLVPIWDIKRKPDVFGELCCDLLQNGKC
jgi:hypothetical protein